MKLSQKGRQILMSRDSNKPVNVLELKWKQMLKDIKNGKYKVDIPTTSERR